VPALKQQVEGYGYETVGSTPAEFAGHIDRELVTWKKAVETSGAKLN
jgi:tripartite-type tricarboxylate transporter receptor subunit TctC